MDEPRHVISYASPAPPEPKPEAKPTPRIVRWFLADFALLFVGMVIMVGAYHDLPNDKSPPPEVDALIAVVMLTALALLVVLVGIVLVGMVRRWAHGGPL
jgi:hypothetical protein